MQLTLHESSQETATGNSTQWTEPGFEVRSLVIDVTQLSLNLLGNVMFKLQHSADGTNWFDVSNLATGNLTATGSVIVSLSDNFPTLNHIRLAWTFTNANSVTFTGVVLGVK